LGHVCQYLVASDQLPVLMMAVGCRLSAVSCFGLHVCVAY
jgi:hypothetical protein